MTKTLIRNGRVVTAVDDYKADVLIEGETVSVIGAKLEMEADRVIDASGKLVIPGGIDPHTHMELPFGGTQASDDFRTGTVAAAHGGTTTIIDFAVQYKGQALAEGLDAWHAKAEGKTAIDYGFHLIVTDLEDERVPELHRAMDEGVTSFKLFMAYPGVFLADDATIFRAMSAAGERGGLICMHAENGVVINEIIKRALQQGRTAPKYHALTRPTRAEAEGVHRAIAIAEMAESPVYIVHLSCADALEQVREARDRGLPAF
ncbi:MAG TPA: amidohydrolase family protein, partial [Pyrinomonadaceae bacterium]|nr:amidohydrolase family protein [Pyrinomonadaceae bacterium]